MKPAQNEHLVLYPIGIHFGITENHNSLEKDLRNRFSKYGNILSFDMTEIKLTTKHHALSPIQVKISFDNEKSRDLAGQGESGKYYNDILRIRPRFCELRHFKEIIAKKQKNKNMEINKLMNCRNYWNKQLYPTDIVKEAMQDSSNEFFIDPSCVYGDIIIDPNVQNRHLLFCLHPSINYPFLIHLSSPTRSLQNIIHIRRQCVNEIARMLWDPNIKKLKRVLPHNFAFGVDWRHYGFALLWGGRSLFSNYLRADSEPFACIKYMINVIKCNVNDPKYECLHVAAMRHDLKLIDFFLKLGVNPLMRSVVARYQETALEKCEWRWKLFCEQRRKENDDEKEQNILDLDDLKQEIDSIDDSVIYLRSLYLSKVLYIRKLGKRRFQNSCFVEVGYGTFDKGYAQFSLKRIEANGKCFAVLIKYDSLCYKELKSLDSCNHFEDGLDLSLSANTKDFSVSFVPYKGLQSQHWFIEKRAIGNDEGMTFCVVIKGKMYQLNVTDGHCLTIKQVSNENEMEKEGRNLDDLLKAMFVILDKVKTHSFVYAKNQYNHYSNWLNYKSSLTGNFEKCQLMNENVVNKLKNAMKIQKLHGNVYKNEDEKSDEYKAKTPQKRIKRFDMGSKQKQNNVHRFKQFKNHSYVSSNYLNRSYGIVKFFDVLKGFGFIRLQNGEDIFVHHSEIRRFQSLMKGQKVQFRIVESNGKRKAVNLCVM